MPPYHISLDTQDINRSSAMQHKYLWA